MQGEEDLERGQGPLALRGLLDREPAHAQRPVRGADVADRAELLDRVGQGEHHLLAPQGVEQILEDLVLDAEEGLPEGLAGLLIFDLGHLLGRQRAGEIHEREVDEELCVAPAALLGSLEPLLALQTLGVLGHGGLLGV